MTLQKDAFETMEDQGLPGVRQLSVFLENRCGQLLRMTQLMENKDVRILSLSVHDSLECAIVRLLTDDADDAIELLRKAGFALSVAEVVVVKVPPGPHGLLQIWKALLRGEINVAYAYPLISQKHGSALVLNVDSLEVAMETLANQGYDVLGEGDLKNGV